MYYLRIFSLNLMYDVNIVIEIILSQDHCDYNLGVLILYYPLYNKSEFCYIKLMLFFEFFKFLL